ncbi:MAG: hypothetical protein WA324_12835 [Bryobacteraceae bacterium]
MPLTVQLNAPVPSCTIDTLPGAVAFLEFDGPNGTGGQVAPIGPLTYATADATTATVDANGNVTQLKAGTVVLTTSDSNGLTASDTLTIVDTAVSATLNIQPLPAAGAVAASQVARSAAVKK